MAAPRDVLFTIRALGLGLINSNSTVGNCISVASGRHACEQGSGETLLDRGNHGDGRFVERCHGCAELYNSCHGCVMLCGGVVSVLYIYLGSAR